MDIKDWDATVKDVLRLNKVGDDDWSSGTSTVHAGDKMDSMQIMHMYIVGKQKQREIIIEEEEEEEQGEKEKRKRKRNSPNTAAIRYDEGLNSWLLV